MATKMIETDKIWAALGEVNDPEFPMSVVDMGLIYGVACEGACVHIRITFTAMGCPAMDMILDDIRARLLREAGVSEVKFEIVWDPPWSKSRLSDKGRELLRSWGVAV
jgi:metal-sulfur cluster biosynthetic enzyme